MFFLFNNDKYIKLDISENDLKTKECIICYDEHSNNNSLYRLKILFNENKIYSKCNCDSFIHKDCFDIWCKESFTCPICRRELYININTINHYIILLMATLILIIIIILNNL